jgi:hypothetical protein
MSFIVYISGPMTDLPQLNFPAFHAAAKALRAMGFEVINPAELNPDPKADWHLCMRTDVKALCDCDGLVLLPGWEDSKGAHLELHLAHRFGMKIETLDKLLDEKGLRAYWDRLALGSTATAAPQGLGFLASGTRIEKLDAELSQLHTYCQAEVKHAGKLARAAARQGRPDLQRKHRAVARAWHSAERGLWKLSQPF